MDEPPRGSDGEHRWRMDKLTSLLVLLEEADAVAHSIEHNMLAYLIGMARLECADALKAKALDS